MTDMEIRKAFLKKASIESTENLFSQQELENFLLKHCSKIEEFPLCDKGAVTLKEIHFHCTLMRKELRNYIFQMYKIESLVPIQMKMYTQPKLLCSYTKQHDNVVKLNFESDREGDDSCGTKM